VLLAIVYESSFLPSSPSIVMVLFSWMLSILLFIFP
jgi:hypothetical protein